MTISLPQRRVGALVKLRASPLERKVATVNEVLALAGKLHHAAFMVRAGWYIACRLLQLSGLRLNGEEPAGGSDALVRTRKKAEAERVVRWTKEFMVKVA